MSDGFKIVSEIDQIETETKKKGDKEETTIGCKQCKNRPECVEHFNNGHSVINSKRGNCILTEEPQNE